MNRPLTPPAVVFVLALLCSTWEARAQKLSAAHLNYILHCQGCHLADGAGTPEKVPALKHDVGRFLHVDGGREFLIQVPGTSQSALTDAEVADVLNWILLSFSPDQLGDDFVPYTTAEISRHRKPLVNVSSVRAGLVAQMSSPASAQ